MNKGPQANSLQIEKKMSSVVPDMPKKNMGNRKGLEFYGLNEKKKKKNSYLSTINVKQLQC